MAILYFRLEQSATVGSPITGDTIVLKWDDTIVPAGNTQASTTNLISLFPTAFLGGSYGIGIPGHLFSNF